VKNPFQRNRPSQPNTVDWIGGSFFAMPQEPRAGRFEGTVQRIRTRTWAGCTFMPDEESSYPELPVLRLGDALAPLKLAPHDPSVVRRMQREAAAWQVRSGYVGAGPPHVRNEDPWADLEPVDHVSLEGFWYPTFQAGTIQGWQVWGIYVLGPG